MCRKTYTHTHYADVPKYMSNANNSWPKNCCLFPRIRSNNGNVSEVIKITVSKHRRHLGEVPPPLVNLTSAPGNLPIIRLP